jgi:hypothetical protein
MNYYEVRVCRRFNGGTSDVVSLRFETDTSTQAWLRALDLANAEDKKPVTCSILSVRALTALEKLAEQGE